MQYKRCFRYVTLQKVSIRPSFMMEYRFTKILITLKIEYCPKMAEKQRWIVKIFILVVTSDLGECFTSTK